MAVDLELDFNDTADFVAVPDWSEATTERQVTHTFLNSLITALLDAKGLFADAETAINDLESIGALADNITGDTENDRAAADLPATYPKGLGFTVITTAGSLAWPDTGLGVLTWKQSATGRLEQTFMSSNGIIHNRISNSADNGWEAWRVDGAYLPSNKDIDDDISTYPVGLSTAPVLEENGWDANGWIFTINNGTTGAQVYFPNNARLIKARISLADAWQTPFELREFIDFQPQITTISDNLAATMNIRRLLTSPYKPVADNNASVYFNSSSFNHRGYATPIGNPGDFRYAYVGIHPYAPVTSVRVIVRQSSNTGTIIADRTFAISPPEDVTTKVLVDFGSVISNSSSCWLQIVADGFIAFYGLTATAANSGDGFYATGASTPASPTWLDVSSGNEPMNWWCEFSETLSDSYDISLTPTLLAALPEYPDDDAINLATLRDWRKALVELEGGTKSPHLAIIGDSWTAGTNASIGYYDVLAEMLYAKYGYGGYGWLTFSNTGSNGAVPNTLRATVTTGGSLTRVDESGSKGLHVGHTRLDDNTAFLQVVTQATEFQIHYIRDTTTSEFRYQVDGGSWTTVAVNHTSEIWAKVDITGLSDASHTLRIEGVSGTPIITGVFAKRPEGTGIILSSLGNGGSATDDWATAAATTLWRNSLGAINPNVVMILHGTNDQAASRPEAALHTNLATIITGVRTAEPLCDILLVSPGDNERSADPVTYTSSIYTMAEYDAFIRRFAVANEYAFISGIKHLGLFADVDARAMMESATPALHLNSLGGKVLAKALFQHLYSVSQPSEIEPVTVVSMPYFTGTGTGSITSTERVYLNSAARTKKKNTTGATHFRSTCWVTTAADAGSVIQLKYSTDNSTWVSIGSTIALDSTGFKETALEFLPLAARGELYFRWFESGGAATTSHTNWDLNTEFYKL